MLLNVAGKKKTSFDLRPLVWHIWHLATFFLLGRLPLVWNRAVAGMRASVCFCASLFMCIKETEECGSMQARAPAFMFISLSGEGECLSQEVSDPSLPQFCVYACMCGPGWRRLLMVGKFSIFARFLQDATCCLWQMGQVGVNDSHFLLFYPTACLRPLQSEYICCFFQPCGRSRALLVRTHSQVKSVGSLGPGAYFCLCNNCFPEPLERRHVCPRTVWGGDVMKDAYEAFSKVVFCPGE